MSEPFMMILFVLLSGGCGVGLGFFLGINVGLWHERRRASETPPRPLKVSFHEHYPEGFCDPDGYDCEPDGRDGGSDDSGGDDLYPRLGPRNN